MQLCAAAFKELFALLRDAKEVGRLDTVLAIGFVIGIWRSSQCVCARQKRLLYRRRHGIILDTIRIVINSRNIQSSMVCHIDGCETIIIVF